MGKYVLSDKKPPKGSKCEVSIGTEKSAGKSIIVRMCGKPATVELCGGMPWETWVCAECARELLNG